MRPKILIVEDESIEAINFKQILKSSGYNVIGIASTGEDAIKMVAELKPDLVLMDIILKGEMDGVEAAGKIKEDFNIPVVYLTAYQEEFNRAKATSPDSYMFKPITKNQLQNTIELALYKHKMNKALKKSEKKYRTLFESMSLGVVYQDKNGVITSTNPAAEEILGLTLDQMQGRTSTDPRWRAVHEDMSDFPGETHPSMEALKTGEKVKNVIMGVYNPEKESYTWININATPLIKNNESNPYQVYTTFEDITERKRAEEALLDSAKSLATAQHIGHIGSWEWNIQTGALKWSDELYHIYGVDLETFTPTMDSFAKYIHPDDLEKINEIINQIISEGVSLEFDFRIITDDGSKHTLRTIAEVTEYDKDGNPLLVVGSNQDITKRKKTEEKLKESEAEYRNLFETMVQGVVYQNEKGEIISANPAAEKILGFKLDEMKGKSSFTRMRTIREDGSSYPENEQPAIIALKTGKIVKNIVMGVVDAKKDRTVWINVNATPKFKNNESKPYQVYITFEDITERKKAEDKYRNALDNMMEGCQIISHDWRYIYVNDTAARHGRIKKEELLGNTMIEIYPGIEETDMFSKLKNTMEERKSNQMENYFTYPDSTGRWFELRVFPVPEGIFILSIDITDRKTAEETINEQYHFLQNLINVIPYPIFYKNKNFQYIGCNKSFEQFLGLSFDEIVGKTVYDVNPKELADKFHDKDKELLETPGSQSYEASVQYADGTMHEILFNKTTFEDKHERVAGLIGIMVDITERKNLETELKESEQKFKTVADFTYDWEYWVAPDGSLLYVSPSCERISGYKPEEFIKDASLLVKITHPNYKEVILKHQSNPAFKKPEEEIEFKIIKKDGEEIWISHNCQPVYNENGEFLGRRASNKDVNDRKIAENALIESEHKFRELVENAADALFVHNFEGNFVDVNQQAIESLGYTREELLQMNVTDVEMDFNLESAQKEWSKIKPSKPFTLYGHQKRKNGAVFPVEVRFAMIEINNEKLFLGLVRDITDIMKAEKELRESEEKYRYVIETAAEGIILFDKKGTIIETNPKALELTGTQDENLVGKNLIQIVPSIKINLKEALSTFKNILSDKPISKTEWEFINKKGEKKFVKANYSPMKKDGKTEGIALVLEDITDLKLRENALRENEQFLENIVENIPDMIFVKSADELKFERVNRAAEQTWGYKRDELIGKTDYDFFTEDEADFYTQNDREVLNKKKLRDIPQETIHTKYMGERMLHTKKIPLFDEKGRSKYLLGISEDVTERKLAEKELKRSLKEKETLLREIHHRVNNNLQIISSLLNLQEEYVSYDPTAVSVLKDSQNRVTSMAMIHELLYQSQDLSNINFSDYLNRMISNLFDIHGTKNIETIIDVGHIYLNIETSVPLGLIISELVSNSLKYAFLENEKGKITVNLTCHDDKYKLIINDNGVGIPEEIDFKNPKSTLGLKLVNVLTKQINGTIELERSHGTQYIIRFQKLKYEKRI